jgi:hypothetical protein
MISFPDTGLIRSLPLMLGVRRHMPYLLYIIYCAISGLFWGIILHVVTTWDGGGWAGGNPLGHIALAVVTGIFVGLAQVRYLKKHKDLLGLAIITPFSVAIGSFIFGFFTMLLFADANIMGALGWAMATTIMSFVMCWWTLPLAFATTWAVSRCLKNVTIDIK